MLQAKIVEKIKTRFMFSHIFFPKILPLMRLFGKIWQIQTGHRWQYNAAILFTFCVTNATNTRSDYVMLTDFHGKNVYKNTPQICFFASNSTSKLTRYTGSLENIPPSRWKTSFSSIKQC